jgi:hypothetical protein
VKSTSLRRLRKAPLLFAAAISVLFLTAGLAAAGAPALAAPAAPAAPGAAVSAMAPNMMAVHGATVRQAVAVHQAARGQVSPDFTCESGYGGWYVDTTGGPYWLWIGSDEPDNDVVTDTTQGSCWHAPDSLHVGEIYNEAGDCLQWNSKTGRNFMNTCNDGTPQRWVPLPTGNGSDFFENIWAEAHAPNDNLYLNQFAAAEDSVTDLGNPEYVPAPMSWIHADCRSSC